MTLENKAPYTLEDIKKQRVIGNYYEASRMKKKYDEWLKKQRELMRTEISRNAGKKYYYENKLKENKEADE